VNNLDLTVQNGGNTYSGNHFSGGWSTTGGTADSINNLENVYIQNPGSSAVITIDATSINGDAVPYNADTTDQDFALVCSNCTLLQDFTLSATPNTQTICTPTDAIYDITVGSNLGYNDIVFLSSAGAPAATTAIFSVNNLAAPYTTTLTIGNTGAATAGSYMIDIVGMGPTTTHTTTVGLNLNTAVPDTPTLLTPANAASNVPTLPTFSWNPSNQGSSYSLEIAADPAFNTIVYSTTTTSTSHPLPSANELNTNTTYHWRVRASNACGTGNDSTVFTFITEPAPGDCGPGTQPRIIYSEDMESGAPGWTHTAGQGSDTWTLSGTNPHSGSMAFHADDLPTISDQYLDSPAIVLPNVEAPLTLKFWNYQELESSSGGCFDGAVLEVSTNGGGSWTRLDSELLTDPYDGTIASGFSNPLAGQNAWCGDPQAYLNSIVDIDAYAGQTVQFRFRLATDVSVSHPGWDIDDVVVQSCELTDPAIAVDPESLGSSQSPDIQVMVPMTISNSGGSALTWDINEASSSVSVDFPDYGLRPANCAIPADIPWITTSPISGTIPGLSSTTVDVIFDSTGYAGGIYTSTLCLNSNDPINPLISVALTMTVPTNQAPAAANDIYSTNQNTVLTVTAPGVLDNDTDGDGDTLTAVLDTTPSHGSLSLNANGSFTYTPDPGFEGNDTFTYHADDGINISNAATVTITVLNTAPIAISDAYSTTEGAALTVPAPGVLSNDTDTDNDALTAVLDSNVTNGTLTLNANGAFTYTPAAGFVGTDSFTYHTNDGTDDSNVVTVTINIVGLSTVETYIPFVITQ
jgi:VCBS repeat-containing protein